MRPATSCLCWSHKLLCLLCQVKEENSAVFGEHACTKVHLLPELHQGLSLPFSIKRSKNTTLFSLTNASSFSVAPARRLSLQRGSWRVVGSNAVKSSALNNLVCSSSAGPSDELTISVLSFPCPPKWLWDGAPLHKEFASCWSSHHLQHFKLPPSNRGFLTFWCFRGLWSWRFPWPGEAVLG